MWLEWQRLQNCLITQIGEWMIKTSKISAIYRSSSFASARIAITIALTVLIVSGSTAGYTLYNSYGEIRDRGLAHAHHHAILSFRAAVDPSIYPTRDQLLENGRHLVRMGQLQGGAFFDSVGEMKGSFGEKPLLTWQRSKLNKIGRVLVDDGRSMEVFVDPHVVDIDFSVALKFDIADTWAAIDQEVARIMVYGLSVSLAVTAAITILLSYLVLYPLHRVQRAVQLTLDEPKDAITHSLKWRREDEVGVFTRNLDRLFYVLSNTFREDLGNALAIQAHTPHGLIIYAPDGQIDDANPAALEFFEAETPDEINEMDQEFLRIDGEVRTVYQVMEAGQTCVQGEILKDGEWLPTLIAGDMIRRSDGRARRYFLLFSDLMFAQLQIDEAIAARDQSIDEIMVQKKQVRSLRGLLDACLAIIENGAPAAKTGRSYTFLPGHAVNAWYREALVHDEMKEDSVRYPLLPQVNVEQELAMRLFSNALSVVQSRSMGNYPNILVTAEERSDQKLVFKITETANSGSDMTTARGLANTNSALYLLAFKNLLRSAKGKMILSAGTDGANVLSFELQAADGFSLSGSLGKFKQDSSTKKVA